MGGNGADGIFRDKDTAVIHFIGQLKVGGCIGALKQHSRRDLVVGQKTHRISVQHLSLLGNRVQQIWQNSIIHDTEIKVLISDVMDFLILQIFLVNCQENVLAGKGVVVHGNIDGRHMDEGNVNLRVGHGRLQINTADFRQLQLDMGIEGMETRNDQGQQGFPEYGGNADPQPAVFAAVGFQQLGVNPTPMAFSEVFTAVQQGVIDGLEIPVASIYSGSYYEACKYVNLTGHFYNAITMSCSKMFWESLSPELQEIFTQAAIEAGQEEREWLAGMEENMLADMEEAGCTVNRDVDQAAFAEAAEPVYESYREIIGSDLMDATLEFLGK